MVFIWKINIVEKLKAPYHPFQKVEVLKPQDMAFFKTDIAIVCRFRKRHFSPVVAYRFLSFYICENYKTQLKFKTNRFIMLKDQYIGQLAILCDTYKCKDNCGIAEFYSKSLVIYADFKCNSTNFWHHWNLQLNPNCINYNDKSQNSSSIGCRIGFSPLTQ